MYHRTLLRAALLGFAITATSPVVATAENIRIMRGAPSAALKVSVNSAVVVESETPFAELSIANPGIADISTLSERTIYVLGKTPGRTTLTLLSADGMLITNVDVQITPDIAEFKERLQQILPGERIEVRTANDGIVLSGTASSTARMDRALDLANRYAPDRVSNLMNVGGNHQVMLEVRFAEVQRSVSKQLDGGLLVDGTDVVGGLGSGVITPGVESPLTGLPQLFTAFDTAENAAGAIIGQISVGSVQLSVLLEALENRGLVRTLAEPNLTALSGQEANFLAGGEFPVPVPDDDGIAIEYRPFGVALDFVPRVVDGEQINLQISAGVSSLDTTNNIIYNGFNVPGFRTRSAATTVEMRDGESFAIAGLLQDDFRDGNSQVPWLGDIPILGALFRSAEYQRNQSELVVIVTAHLVSPTRSEALSLPTSRVRPPSEAEFFLLGKTASTPPTANSGANEVARQDFSGSYGYVLE